MDSPAGRAFLRQEYGLEPRDLRRLAGATADNYQVGPLLIKHHRMQTAQTLAFEEACLQRLAGFPAPLPVPARGAAWVTHFQGRPVTALRFIPGESLTAFSEAELFQVGGLLARFHLLLRDVPPAPARPSWDPRAFLGALRADGAVLRGHSHLDGPEWYAFGLRELARFEDLPELPAGATHQDVKPENVVRDLEGRLHLIDFGNARHGAWLVDLMTVASWCPPTEPLLAGYTAERALEEVERRNLERVRRYRLLREALSWPSRHDTPESARHARHFRARYEG